MDATLRVRRARRADFERVRALLELHGPGERAERKRFRRLVSTLREDLYLAERTDDSSLVGLAVLGYTRGLGPPTAVVRRLVATSPTATSLLLDCARARARARDCSQLELQLDQGVLAVAPSLPETLARRGWTEGPQVLVCRVAT